MSKQIFRISKDQRYLAGDDLFIRPILLQNQGVPDNLEVRVDRLDSSEGTTGIQQSSGENIEIYFGQGYSVDQNARHNSPEPYLRMIEPDKSYNLNVDKEGVRLKVSLNATGTDYRLEETDDDNRLILNYQTSEVSEHIAPRLADMGFDSIPYQKEILFGSDIAYMASTLADAALESLIVFDSTKKEVTVYAGDDIREALDKYAAKPRFMSYVAIISPERLEQSNLLD